MFNGALMWLQNILRKTWFILGCPVHPPSYFHKTTKSWSCIWVGYDRAPFQVILPIFREQQRQRIFPIAIGCVLSTHSTHFHKILPCPHAPFWDEFQKDSFFKNAMAFSRNPTGLPQAPQEFSVQTCHFRRADWSIKCRIPSDLTYLHTYPKHRPHILLIPVCISQIACTPRRMVVKQPIDSHSDVKW